MRETVFLRFCLKLVDTSRRQAYSTFSRGTPGSKVLKLGSLIIQVLVLTVGALAGPVILDFEGFPDSTVLTTQYPGLTFTNTIILTAGISLDEFEFPPNSGVNVASDNGGPIGIIFATPVLSLGAYFTYAEPLALVGLDAGDNQVATASSAYSNNEALSGESGSGPNEFISVASVGGISEVTITGDPAGGSFAMDDVTLTTPVPEPKPVFPALIAGCALIIKSRLRKIL